MRSQPVSQARLSVRGAVPATFKSTDEIYAYIDGPLKKKARAIPKGNIEQGVQTLCADVLNLEERFKLITDGSRGEVGYFLCTAGMLIQNEVIGNPQIVDANDPDMDFVKKSGLVLHPLLYGTDLSHGNKKLFVNMNACMDFDHSASNILVPVKRVETLSGDRKANLSAMFGDDFDPSVGRFNEYVVLNGHDLDTQGFWMTEGLSRNVAMVIGGLSKDEDEVASHENAHLILLNNYQPITLQHNKDEIFSVFVYKLLTMDMLKALLQPHEVAAMRGHGNVSKYIREDADMLFHEFIAMGVSLTAKPVQTISALLASHNPPYVLARAFLVNAINEYDGEKGGNVLEQIQHSKKSITKVLQDNPEFVKYANDMYLMYAKGFYKALKKS